MKSLDHALKEFERLAREAIQIAGPYLQAQTDEERARINADYQTATEKRDEAWENLKAMERRRRV